MPPFFSDFSVSFLYVAIMFGAIYKHRLIFIYQFVGFLPNCFTSSLQSSLASELAFDPETESVRRD